MLTLSFVGLVLLTFVTVVAVPCNLAALPLLAALQRVRPQARSPLLLLFVATPWLLGGGVLLSSIVDIFFGACDVGEVCLWNEDPRFVSHVRALVIVPVLAALLAVSFRLIRHVFVSRTAIRTIRNASDYDATQGVYLFESPTALAFASGDRVYVSTSLRAALTDVQFRAVMLHERAHLQRSDGACQLVARVLSCALLPPVRRRVLDAFSLANEQACDEIASQQVGPLETAGAILAASRVAAGKQPVLSPAFSESFVPQRIHRLLDPKQSAWRSGSVYATAVCAMLSLFLIGDLLYYTGMLILFPFNAR